MMTPLYRAELGVATAAVAWLVFFVFHLAAWQTMPRPRKGVMTLVLAGSCGYCLVMASGMTFLRLPMLDTLWISGPCFALFLIMYMHLYFGIDRSVSIRILGELACSPTGALTLDALDKVYSRDDMIARRLAVMVEKGLLRESGGQYTCTDKSRLHVRFALLGKKLYGLDVTG